MNSIHIINSTSHQQITIAGIVKILLFTAIITNHCSSRWPQYSPSVKARFLRDFSRLQQHPMLPSAYLKELTPQSSKGSKLLPQQTEVSQKALFSGSFSQQKYPKISSLSSKGFHSRNTLEVQPSFRNSLLNTVYHCKPQSAILFYLPLIPFWYIRAQSPDFQQL